MGSLSGRDNCPGREVANTASKFGLRGVMHSLREELRSQQIGVTVINPGNVLGYWGVGLSVRYALGFHFGMGSTGLWIGQSVAIAVVAGLFICRLRKSIVQRKLGDRPLAIRNSANG
jgi:NAD(P)-dependent dehydrogenase (short-subunit alcohol dehydrogenase family)